MESNMLNAVYWLELRTRAREKKLWILVVAITIMLAAVSGLVVGPMFFAKSQIRPPHDVGATISMTIISLQMGILFILAPLSTAGRLSQEREQRTLSALLNSPASRSRIVLGKLLAAWTFIVWLAMLPLPAIFVAALWGGEELYIYLGCIIINSMAACTLASIALGFSGYCGRSMTSNLLTGVTLFGWLLVLPILGGLMYQDRGILQTLLPYLCFYHHPAYPLIVHLGNWNLATVEPYQDLRLVYCLMVWLAINIISFIMAVRGLKREYIS